MAPPAPVLFSMTIEAFSEHLCWSSYEGAHSMELLTLPSTRDAARWLGGRLSKSVVFENNEGGLAAFKEHLAREPNLPAHMIVDAVEEDYRFESLPHSFGSDRGEMITRKLKQHYRNTPYCSARIQGRDPGKRRDDRYLFCALTNPELIAGWQQAIIERELPVYLARPLLK